MLVTRHQFQAAQFASKDETREQLMRVRVRQDGSVEATNGHVLIRVAGPGDSGLDREVYLDRDIAERLAAKPIISSPIELTVVDGRAEITEGMTVIASDIDSSSAWPDTERYWEQKPVEGSVSVKLDARYLLQLFQMASDNGRRQNGITFTIPPNASTGPGSAIHFAWIGPEDEKVTGRLMPMRM